MCQSSWEWPYPLAVRVAVALAPSAVARREAFLGLQDGDRAPRKVPVHDGVLDLRDELGGGASA